MYAIIEDRGTQIKVAAGDVLDIDVFQGDQPKKITFDRVLLVGDTAKAAAGKVGKPYVAGATVNADVVEMLRGDKVDVVMYKRRKGQRRQKGHRQDYLRIKITGING